MPGRAAHVFNSGDGELSQRIQLSLAKSMAQDIVTDSKKEDTWYKPLASGLHVHTERKKEKGKKKAIASANIKVKCVILHYKQKRKQ